MSVQNGHREASLIARYGLAEWWDSVFSAAERKLIETRCPFLIHSNQQVSQPVSDFLNVLAGWFRSPEHKSIAHRIRDKIDELGRTCPLDEPGCFKGRHFTTYVGDVETLIREGKLAEAEELLFHLVDATERESIAEKTVVAPWYYEKLAVVCRKAKDPAKEVAILERFLAQNHQPHSGVSDRLTKARALLEADSARPASSCPYCGVEITPPPKATGKCPACGERIVRAKGPGEEFATLFTIEQAEENKKNVELSRARKKALDHARKIGCTDSEFAAKDRELAKKWGKTPSPNDVFWEISNGLLSRSPSFDKYSRWGKLHSIYEHQARVLVEEGKPHVHVAKEASKAHLHQLEEMSREMGLKQEVFIATGKNCCPECTKLDGQRMSFSKALDTLPIPNEQCMHERCQCSWKIDYGDPFKQPVT